MKVVGKGNANLLIDFGDPRWLYRCCVRYEESLKRNNEYSMQNMQFILKTAKVLLGELLCPMELEILPLETLKSVLNQYIANLDDTEVVVFKIPNLKPKDLQQVAYEDHFTRIYISTDLNHALMEVKPKWIHSPSRYCRNCTHSNFMGREVRYCYNKINQDPLHLRELLVCAGDIPLKFQNDLNLYLTRGNNVLAVLYEAQRALDHNPLVEIDSIADVSDSMSLAMTLRDVTCFIEWFADADELRVNVVDVDLKPNEKFKHWRRTQLQLDNFDGKCYH